MQNVWITYVILLQMFVIQKVDFREYLWRYLSTILLNCASFKLPVHCEEASSVINVTCMIIKCIIFFQKNYFCNGLSVLDLIYNQMLILEDSHLSFILDKPLRFTSIRYISKKKFVLLNTYNKFVFRSFSSMQ